MHILITGAWRYTAAQLDALRAMGHTVSEMPDERGPLPCPYETVEGVICNGLFLHHHIERFTALRYIQLTSAGFDRVPLNYVQTHGIEIHNARGVYSVPMAEFAVTSVLYFYKQLPFFGENQTQHKWDKHRGLRELCGKTVCIVGCGSVGTACAERFSAFGCRVIGVDICEGQNPAFAQIRPVADLHAALAAADVVVLTVPLTEQTTHLLDAAALAAMKSGAVLVNIARGAVVDTEALCAALAQKTLYAALDVFEEEPLSADSPLWEMENVLLTPHNSFVGDGNADRLWNVIQTNLRDMT